MSEVCIFCKQDIEVVNPLELEDGFAHRTCWIKNTMAKIGVKK